MHYCALSFYFLLHFITSIHFSSSFKLKSISNTKVKNLLAMGATKSKIAYDETLYTRPYSSGKIHTYYIHIAYICMIQL